MQRLPRGLSMVDVMVTAAVIGIVSAIALPSFRSSSLRVHRVEAKAELLQAASALERCFARFNDYDHADCRAQVALPRVLPSGRYLISATAVSDEHFQLQAVPQGKQAADRECGTLLIDSAGIRSVSAGATQVAARCWSP
jgi:type IV pilus assembly protein PilE